MKKIIYFAVGIAIGAVLAILPVHADITQNALLVGVNNERQASNLPALVENKDLDQAAALKAADMVKGSYFSHVSPQKLTPWYFMYLANYQYKSAGENLALNFEDSDGVVKAWLASPTHKANIMNTKYQDVGYAVTKTKQQGKDVTLVVQMFGEPKPIAQ